MPLNEQPKPGDEINAKSEIKEVVFLDTVRPISVYLWFYAIGTDADHIFMDMKNLNTSKVTNMNSLFVGVGENANTVTIYNMDEWDTSNVTDMSGMFAQVGKNANTVTIENIGGWNTSNVTSMDSMFRSTGKNATSWSIGTISGWDTSNVTSMTHMFKDAGVNASYTLDLSGWNVSKVTRSDNFNAGVESKVILPAFK